MTMSRISPLKSGVPAKKRLEALQGALLVAPQARERAVLDEVLGHDPSMPSPFWTKR